MRCSDCAKFVETDGSSEPEVELEASPGDEGKVSVTGSVKIVNCCAECGSELQEATFDVDLSVAISHREDCAKSETYTASLEAERIEEFIPPAAKRQKHMYGAEGEVVVTCDDCDAASVPVSWKDTVQSSAMDSMQ